MKTRIDNVWKQVPPTLVDALVVFWRENKAIPVEAEARKRAQQAVCVLRDEGDAICGVATAEVRVIPRLRQPTYYYRIFLARAMRGRDAFLPMVQQSKQILQEFNNRLDKPESLGLLFEIENGKLGKAYPHACEPTFDATFIGYSPRGQQLYVSYFPNAMLQAPARIAVRRDAGGSVTPTTPAQQQSG